MIKYQFHLQICLWFNYANINKTDYRQFVNTSINYITYNLFYHDVVPVTSEVLCSRIRDS